MPPILEAIQRLLVLHAEQPRALLAHRQRLMLDDVEQPRVRRLRIQAGRARAEHLQRTLVGVLRIGRATGVAARDLQERLGVVGHHPHDEVLRIGLRR